MVIIVLSNFYLLIAGRASSTETTSGYSLDCKQTQTTMQTPCTQAVFVQSFQVL
jgi:hypothetical protein